MSNILTTLRPLMEATKRARGRTGDKAIGVNVAQGRFNVVRVTYDERGVSTVTTLRADLTMNEAVAALDAMGAPAR